MPTAQSLQSAIDQILAGHDWTGARASDAAACIVLRRAEKPADYRPGPEDPLSDPDFCDTWAERLEGLMAGRDLEGISDVEFAALSALAENVAND